MQAIANQEYYRVYPMRHRHSAKRARRRFIVKSLAALVLAFALLALLPSVVHMATGADATPMISYTVASNDTLWEIAALHSGGDDIRKVLYAIEKANRLQSGVIRPGQVLEIPQFSRR